MHCSTEKSTAVHVTVMQQAEMQSVQHLEMATTSHKSAPAVKGPVSNTLTFVNVYIEPCNECL